MSMLFQLATLHKLSRDNFVLGLKFFEGTRGVAQAITQEITEYGRRTVQQSAATCEKLVDSKTLDDTIDVQTDHAKAALHDFVAQSRAIGELYQALAKEAAKSITAALAKQTVEEPEIEPARDTGPSEVTALSVQPANAIDRSAVKHTVASAVKEAVNAARQAASAN
jgi:Phasin protein